MTFTRQQIKPTFVLVHGAWHGSWCWHKVVNELDAQGWPNISVDLPSVGAKGGARFGLHDDAAVIREAIDSVTGPVVVVAHSYGGAPASEAAVGADNVRHLVYVSALQPDEGDSPLALMGGVIPPWVDANEETSIPRNPQQVFYHDVDPHESHRAALAIKPQDMLTLHDTVGKVAWKNVPSTYVICELDQAIPVAGQEMMASRATAIRRLSTAHAPFLSRPELLIDVLTETALRQDSLPAAS